MKKIINSIYKRLYWSKNLLLILKDKLFLFFNKTHDVKAIPEGQYCYVPDFEKNKASTD
jgi:hypothetical protein